MSLLRPLEALLRLSNRMSWRHVFEKSWQRFTETSLSFSLETYLRVSLGRTEKLRYEFATTSCCRVAVDDKFNKPFISYLGENAVHNFISSMIKEGEYCSNVMKKHFNKELMMTKKDNKNFENSTKCWVCDCDYIDNDIKVKYQCHITAKYRASAHRDCNTNVKLNHKIAVVFHTLKNSESHLILLGLGKFNLKANVIPNGLEKYMSFSINNKLNFIDSFQFLSSSLDGLVKNLNKDYFKYLSQEFDNNV